MEIKTPIEQIEDVRRSMGEAKTVQVLAAFKYLEGQIALTNAKLAKLEAELNKAWRGK